MNVLQSTNLETVSLNSVIALTEKYNYLSTRALLEVFIQNELQGRIALVSSFGTESAVILHLISEIDRSTPVIFLDTEKLFAETLTYRDQLVELLKLDNVQTIKPDPKLISEQDPGGELWRVDPQNCCEIRKVLPLEQAIAPYDGWITGRKRFHGDQRAHLPLIELSNGKIKLNPLAEWSLDDIERYYAEHALPEHPLKSEGYLSIGCAVCTAKTKCANNPRAGRWVGLEKTECGIHFDEDGKIKRRA